MSIPATEAITPSGLYQSPTAAAGTDADKEMFLNLLVAQLRYQDPSNPADSSEFLAQNAQFTALEKMQDVADQTAALLNAQVAFGAAGMVSKNVTYLKSDGTSATGVVSSVSYDASGPMLVIDGESVSLGQISSVSATPSPAPAG
ncbi:flagellar hook capping protein [Nocardioides sp. MAH-18]|uniref:Flagellar hook capping protein n=1 Tax=Nocardioides agri TaxID=2682843 RepID=A0A6L6XYX0_9ACTN|nr:MULTISPECIES: flagellar hook capping FlgD N-terminal domain-containing protein [unclassified Nocardioides]MBA2955775.1 flagellar hook capping protein [Nocardioides sp. CGMCC 1.13656]MVQ50625.1 flagellar hook capping protein [Nocardioides sp. MAH-18]